MLKAKIYAHKSNGTMIEGIIQFKDGKLQFLPNVGGEKAMEFMKKFKCMDKDYSVITKEDDPERWLRLLPRQFLNSSTGSVVVSEEEDEEP